MPATAIKRHTELYEAVYGASLKKELEKKCEAEVETGAATQKFVVLSACSGNTGMKGAIDT